MRIIAGKFKGKTLATFNLDSTRPTSDMVRESLFNLLYNVNGKNFLDLFGGTGAVALEAVSRGAKATAVDSNKEAFNIMQKNASIAMGQINLLQMDALKAIDYLSAKGEKFDYVFLDPPYKTNLAEEALEKFKLSNIVSADTLFIWEHDKTKLNASVNGYNIIKQKKYGIKYLTILSPNDTQSQ